MDRSKFAPHIYIVGQTASGKTGFSLDLCEDLGFEVLNTDSLLFYKGLNIGTAKPTVSELSRVKHHLVDVSEPGDELTAADYLDAASEVLSSDKPGFLCVGGSGFYINALDVGLLPLPETAPSIKEKVLQIESPVEELEKVDPGFFDKISKNDLYRVGRALEVYLQTGKPLSQWQKEFKAKPFAKKIAFELDRDFLRERITLRAKKMFKEGLIDEVKDLLSLDVPNWKPLSSVGYAQVVRLLSGEIETEEKALEEVVHKTMQLSKRQKTWFKRDKSVKWFDFNDKQKARDYIIQNFEEASWKV